MPDAPSPEASSAHYILTILLGHHWLGRNRLAVASFTLPLAKRRWKDAYFDRGMEYAIKKDWVEVSIPKSFKLN